MKTERTPILALLALGLLTAFPAGAHGGPAGLDKRISIDLAGAAAADVFDSFGSILDVQVALDPALEGEVTIQLSDVSVRTTLTAMCEMLDCRWALEEGPPQRLVIKEDNGKDEDIHDGGEEEPPGTLDTRVSLSLRDAPAEQVLRSFAEIGGWKLVLEKPTVTIELDDTPVAIALDEVCAQIRCRWQLDTASEEGVLRVDRLD